MKKSDENGNATVGHLIMFLLVVTTYLSIGIVGYIISREKAGELSIPLDERFSFLVSIFLITGGVVTGIALVVAFTAHLVGKIKKHKGSQTAS